MRDNTLDDDTFDLLDSYYGFSVMEFNAAPLLLLTKITCVAVGLMLRSVDVDEMFDMILKFYEQNNAEKWHDSRLNVPHYFWVNSLKTFSDTNQLVSIPVVKK